MFFRLGLALVVLSSVLLNINTLNHGYALDDEMVIGKNVNVHMGASGLGRIFATDAYQGYLDYVDAKNPLSGGRYRPLSIASFAIEEELFGAAAGKGYMQARRALQASRNANRGEADLRAASEKVAVIERSMKASALDLAPVRHATQVLFHALSMAVLFWFLHGFVFRLQPAAALCASLLFVFHPVHTEVVANVKSRDEIFSMMFILLTLVHIFRYVEQKQPRDLGKTLLAFAAALFSKEYALMVPFVALAGVCILYGRPVRDAIRTTWFISLCAMTAGFLALRFTIANGKRAGSGITDVLNDPYLYASPAEEVASKLAVLTEYFRLLLFPHPLSSDYSFSHFPYVGLSNPRVWLSVFLVAMLIGAVFYFWRKKHVLAFAGSAFLAFFLPVCNLLFDIGATMGERLIYHSSLGFCIAAGWALVKGIQRIGLAPRYQRIAVAGVMCAVLGLMGYKTVARNADWRNDFTLFTTDVHTVPNSALTNGNAGAEYYNKGFAIMQQGGTLTQNDSLLAESYIDSALLYLGRSVDIHPKYVNSHMNLALCYLHRNRLDLAEASWKKAATHFNGRNSALAAQAAYLLSKAAYHGERKEYALASRYLRIAAVIDAGNAEIFENLGGAEFMQGHFAEAADAFSRSVAANPGRQGARQGLRVATYISQLERKCAEQPTNAAAWQELADVYVQNNFPELAVGAARHVLALKPNDVRATESMRKANEMKNR